MSLNEPNKGNKSWPWGIAVFYSVFVLALLGSWYFTTFHKPDLVETNYYQKSITYQQKIDAMENVKQLSAPPAISINPESKTLKIILPAEFKNKTVNGDIRFYRPSDSRLDFNRPFQPDSAGSQVISISGLAKGKWQIQLSWHDGKTHYFMEHMIIL